MKTSPFQILLCCILLVSFGTTGFAAKENFDAKTEMIMPGDSGEIRVKLIVPVAMDKGLRFAIREGGRTVGAGQVTEIVK